MTWTRYWLWDMERNEKMKKIESKDTGGELNGGNEDEKFVKRNSQLSNTSNWVQVVTADEMEKPREGRGWEEEPHRGTGCGLGGTMHQGSQDEFGSEGEMGCLGRIHVEFSNMETVLEMQLHVSAAFRSYLKPWSA